MIWAIKTILRRYFIKAALPAAALLLFAIPLSAQEDSVRTLVSTRIISTHGTSVNVYPFAFYNPELKFAFGAGGIITFYTGEDAILRPSKISLSGFYSTSNQYSISLAPQVYLRHNLLFISGKLYYGDKTYFTPDEDYPELDATSYGVAAEMRIGKNPHTVDPLGLTDLKQLGIIFDYEHVRFVDESGFGDLPPHNFGVGLARLWDSRDGIFYPTNGKLLRLEALFFNRALGSSFNFNRYKIDLRWYRPISKVKKQVLAFQTYAEMTAGHPPLHQLPPMGGSNLMRGYTSGTYRDRLYLAAQAEFRTHIWWRLGAAAFAGVGDVANKFSDFGLRGLKYSYGGGARFLFNKKESVNLRADLGFGEDTDGVYFGLEEAF